MGIGKWECESGNGKKEMEKWKREQRIEKLGWKNKNGNGAMRMQKREWRNGNGKIEKRIEKWKWESANGNY